MSITSRTQGLSREGSRRNWQGRAAPGGLRRADRLHVESIRNRSHSGSEEEPRRWTPRVRSRAGSPCSRTATAPPPSPLWQAYFRRLVALARDRLRGTSRRAADEEDVALAAFDSFYRRAERGQFPDLEDRDDLWRLLFVLTVRKAVDLARREARQPGRDDPGRSLCRSRPSATSICSSARSPPPSSPPWWPTSAGTARPPGR